MRFNRKRDKTEMKNIAFLTAQSRFTNGNLMLSEGHGETGKINKQFFK